jgi:hypothetical protein
MSSQGTTSNHNGIAFQKTIAALLGRLGWEQNRDYRAQCKLCSSINPERLDTHDFVIYTRAHPDGMIVECKYWGGSNGSVLDKYDHAVNRLVFYRRPGLLVLGGAPQTTHRLSWLRGRCAGTLVQVFTTDEFGGWLRAQDRR